MAKQLDSSQLSLPEQKQLVLLLKKLEAGFLPYDVFVQISRLVVLSIIEFVPMRFNKNNELELLLLSRGEDDPIWPGILHTPGTVIRPTDTEGKIYVAFERILQDELCGTIVSSPHYVGSNLHKSKRGMEQAQIYWVEVLGTAKVGTFYPLDSLPPTLMNSQRAFINLAAKSFLKTRVT